MKKPPLLGALSSSARLLTEGGREEGEGESAVRPFPFGGVSFVAVDRSAAVPIVFLPFV